MMDFQNRLNELIKITRISDEQVVCALQTRKEILSDWKHGKAVPDVNQAIQLGKLFHVSLEYLLNGAPTAEDAKLLKRSLSSDEIQLDVKRELATTLSSIGKSFDLDEVMAICHVPKNIPARDDIVDYISFKISEVIQLKDWGIYKALQKYKFDAPLNFETIIDNEIVEIDFYNECVSTDHEHIDNALDAFVSATVPWNDMTVLFLLNNGAVILKLASLEHSVSYSIDGCSDTRYEEIYEPDMATTKLLKWELERRLKTE